MNHTDYATPNNENKLHSFPPNSLEGIPLPKRFTYPFCYAPHPLCILAASQVQAYLTQNGYENEKEGKMFGVLAVQTPDGEIGYLAAFSGIWNGNSRHPYFVPPVYDLQQPDGYFRQEEQAISAINARIACMTTDTELLRLESQKKSLEAKAHADLEEARRHLREAKARRDARRAQQPPPTPTETEQMTRESQHLKAGLKRLERQWKQQLENIQNQLEPLHSAIEHLKTERRKRSAALQKWVFGQFRLRNAQGEEQDLFHIFEHTPQGMPPAGAGECAAPKLLQHAYLHGWKPLCMAEFWWGKPPTDELRLPGHYYPACLSKCGPILTYMMQGLEVDPNPLSDTKNTSAPDIEIVYEDEWIIVINKPAGLLSVPGKDSQLPSVYSLMHARYPQAEGPLMVHRLDMDTSGLMIITKTKQAHQQLQADFSHRRISKRYVALLDGIVETEQGTIDLPICPDPTDRPRQIVSLQHGKPASTSFKVLQRKDGRTLIALWPHTGRTHQLRVHTAHHQGLKSPIAGDRLYGRVTAPRLCLHAEGLEFVHPITGQRMTFCRKGDFY